MAIPDYQTLMLPLLRLLSDGRERSLAEVVDGMCESFALSADDRQKLLPSGTGLVIQNRCGWARTHLKKAGLLESTRRGFFRISEAGLTTLASNPPAIDNQYLRRFPEFVAFEELCKKNRTGRREDAAQDKGGAGAPQRTPPAVQSFESALAEIDRSELAGDVALAEAEREEMLRRFPLERWPRMTLEEFALGHEGSSSAFCFWMEFKALKLGSMRGGNAQKMIVYKHKNASGWYYPGDFTDEHEAWRKLRSEFVRALEHAEAGAWDQIDALEVLGHGPALKLKTLHLYYPDQVLPISSRTHLRRYLQLVTGSDEHPHQQPVALNRTLLAALRARPELAGWSTQEMMRFLYRWSDPRAEETKPRKLGSTDVNHSTAAQIAPPLYLRLEKAIERKQQVVLYGPPGTGKTFAAGRFAAWWLLRGLGDPDADAVLSDSKKLAEAERRLSQPHVEHRVWWVVANPKEWSWDQLFEGEPTQFRYGRVERNYSLVCEGDLVVGYQSTPDKRIVALARVVRGFTAVEGGDPTFTVEGLAHVKQGPSYEELRADSQLSRSEPMRVRNQGTLFALTHTEASHLLSILTEREPELSQVLGGEIGSDSTVGHLTRVTFHPSYTYEDFIEGFRPTDDGRGLSLHLEDGVFKRVCRAALAHPEQRYLVLIDEFNRGNVAKVLGELLTLLERDKRGQIVLLPQSKEAFAVPPNVFLLGTMNTADRSIKLLDVALRRRFAFLELMPDIELLRGAKVGDLDLHAFLEGLNRRIAEKEGREKQIGHSYLLDDGKPISDVEEFSCRFREEILPLLQEYCYDEYSTLAHFIGRDLVDDKLHRLNEEALQNPEQLVAMLAKEFSLARVVERAD
jgi:hypothetical protein